MRNARTGILVMIAAVLVAATLWKQGLAQSGETKPATTLRVAVCDALHVFDNYRRVKDLNVELQKKREGMDAEEQKRLKAIDDLEKELGLLAETSKEYETQLEKMLLLQNELEVWKKTEEALLLRWRFRLTRQMFEEILQAVEDVANKQGYHLVLFKESPTLQARNTTELVQEMFGRRKVLYNDAGLDITEAVLAQLNLRYRTAGS